MSRPLDSPRLVTEEKGRWVLQKGLQVVASPDVDGLLCALMGCHYLQWEMKGFYNGKVLVLFGEKPVPLRELAFLDVEICHPQVRSLGNHMLIPGPGWEWLEDRFRLCLNPNLLRGFTRREFQRKYPFGSFHFLLALFLAGGVPVDIETIPAHLLLYPDSSLHNFLNYPENCKDWLAWLAGDPPVVEVQEGLIQRLGTLSLRDTVHTMREWYRVLQDETGLTPGPRGLQRNLDPSTPKGWDTLNTLWGLLQNETGWTCKGLPRANEARWTGPMESTEAKSKGSFSEFQERARQGRVLSLALTGSGTYQVQYTVVPECLLPFWGEE